MSKVKTNQFLWNYKDRTPDTYEDIAKIAGISYDRVVKCFRDPSRCGVEAMVGICVALHIPLEEGRKEWLKCHLERETESRNSKWDQELQRRGLEK